MGVPPPIDHKITTMATLDKNINSLQLQTKSELGSNTSGMMVFTMCWENNGEGHAFVMASDINDPSQACLIEPNDLYEKGGFRGIACTENTEINQFTFAKKGGETNASELLFSYMQKHDLPPTTTFTIENSANTMITITSLPEIIQSFESSKHIAKELSEAYDFSHTAQTGTLGLYSTGGTKKYKRRRITKHKSKRIQRKTRRL
jgi:hypothetical protein